jgi:hypothetical protein
MGNIQKGYNKLNGSGDGVSMDHFRTLSPFDSDSHPDVIKALLTALAELALTRSITFSGWFTLDLQTGALSLEPDPRPVFNWSFKVSLDDNTRSVTLEIDVEYDHMESNSVVEALAAIFLGLITNGLFDVIAGSVTAVAPGVIVGIAAGESLTRAYNAGAEGPLLDFIGSPFDPLPWVIGPIMFTISHPETADPKKPKFVLSVAIPLDSTTWNEIAKYFPNPDLVTSLAKTLRLAT